jgi:hypothetical protein
LISDGYHRDDDEDLHLSEADETAVSHSILSTGLALFTAFQANQRRARESGNRKSKSNRVASVRFAVQSDETDDDDDEEESGDDDDDDDAAAATVSAAAGAADVGRGQKCASSKIILDVFRPLAWNVVKAGGSGDLGAVDNLGVGVDAETKRSLRKSDAYADLVSKSTLSSALGPLDVDYLPFLQG